MAEEKLKTCFVAGPIGDEGSEIRLEADWLLDEIISPALATVGGFGPPVRSDRHEMPGMIDAQMFAHLFEDDLVIADMTGLNANAFYEIGIRHMREKPIIHMHQAGTKIPFDVGSHRSIQYGRQHPRELASARRSLIAQIKHTLSPGYRVENPATNARGRINLRNTADPEMKTIMDEIESQARQINELRIIDISAVVRDEIRRMESTHKTGYSSKIGRRYLTASANESVDDTSLEVLKTIFRKNLLILSVNDWTKGTISAEIAESASKKDIFDLLRFVKSLPRIRECIVSESK